MLVNTKPTLGFSFENVDVVFADPDPIKISILNKICSPELLHFLFNNLFQFLEIVNYSHDRIFLFYFAVLSNDHVLFFNY